MHFCSKCAFQTRQFFKLISHYRFVHSHQHGFKLSCPVDSCEQTYTNIDSLIRHTKRKHRNFHDLNLSKYKDKNRDDTILEALVEVNDEEVENEDEIQGDDMDNLVQVVDINFHKKLGIFLLSLREKYKLPSVVMPVIVNELISMIGHHQAQISQSLNKFVRDHIINENDITDLKEILEKHSDVENALGSLDSEYKLNSFAKKNLNFIQPIEFKPNRNRNETYQYVPILETLKNLLSHDDVFSYVVNSHKSTDGILRDFCDGQAFRSSPLFPGDPSALQIIFYFDEFTAVNPIGHQIKNYKIGGFYMLLGNLPPKFRSKLYTIQLVMLCLSSCIKYNGFETILEPLINDLKTLETEGVVVTKDDGEHTFFGLISVVLADNLGAHGLGGFMESFNTLRNCRFCFVSREDMQNTFQTNGFNMRSVEMYNEQVRLVQGNPDLSRTYGLKNSSALNQLNFYHVAKGMPSDIAHDLFEGVVCEVVTNVIKACVVAGYFSFEDLNEKITSFVFSDTDKSNKPSKVGLVLRTFKVRQSAAQMWCLVRHLPLLVGEFVPLNDQKWETLLCLRDMLFYVCAPALGRGHILSMADVIEDFHRVYRQNFPDVTVKPKFHYTLHYPHLTLLYGPLINHQTLRFEGKHNYFKELVYRTKNRKNLCKSLAERHQYYQCTFNSSDKFLIDNENGFEPTGGSVLSVCLLNGQLQGQLQRELDSEEIFTCKSLMVQGVTYWRNAGIVHDVHGFMMQFSRIQHCAVLNGKPYLLCRRLRTVDFERHFHSFAVTNTDQYELVKISNLKDPNPLGIYTHPRHPHLRLIVPKFKVLA